MVAGLQVLQQTKSECLTRSLLETYVAWAKQPGGVDCNWATSPPGVAIVPVSRPVSVSQAHIVCQRWERTAT